MEDKAHQSEPMQSPTPTGNTTSNSFQKNRMYPELIIPNNTHPDKLFAFPVVGLVIKFIMCIPVFIVSIFVGFITGILLLITPFTILFGGRYWNTGYIWVINYLTYFAKMQLFLAGITDKYPGFTFDSKGIFEMHLPKPQSPNRFLGFPVIGILIRAILIIPFYIYTIILSYGMYIAVAASWFGVWIKGSYPESLYEFIKDEMRVSFAYSAYIYYLSDTYPSFKISMNHKKIKILLILLGIIIALIDTSRTINNDMKTYQHAPTYNNASPSNTSGYGK